MAILIIDGPPKSGKSLIANGLRNTAISAGKGALLIDDHADGDAIHHLEKIIKADKFVSGTPAEEVNWKPDPQIILVNSGAERLKDFDAICPGFTAKFGPVRRMPLQ